MKKKDKVKNTSIVETAEKSFKNEKKTKFDADVDTSNEQIIEIDEDIDFNRNNQWCSNNTKKHNNQSKHQKTLITSKVDSSYKIPKKTQDKSDEKTASKNDSNTNDKANGNESTSNLSEFYVKNVKTHTIWRFLLNIFEIIVGC